MTRRIDANAAVRSVVVEEFPDDDFNNLDRRGAEGEGWGDHRGGRAGFDHPRDRFIVDLREGQMPRAPF